MFYRKTDISVLGFVVNYIDDNDNAQNKHFDYMSKCLSHETYFVKNCIEDLLRKELFKDTKKYPFGQTTEGILSLLN